MQFFFPDLGKVTNFVWPESRCKRRAAEDTKPLTASVTDSTAANSQTVNSQNPPQVTEKTLKTGALTQTMDTGSAGRATVGVTTLRMETVSIRSGD